MPPSLPPPGVPRHGAVAAAGILLALAAAAAYAGSFSGPFIFDDPSSITDNPTLRQLWPLWRVLAPPHGGLTVEGRPILNLSLALNYAAGGTRVAGYHAANLLIHLLAGLALFGVVRRTLLQPRWRERYGAASFGLGFAVAALWTLHPLQTEAVTYVVQRAESLMGLFYLLTFYGFIRSAEAQAEGTAGRTGWGLLAVAACLLGMGTKEVMVTAPVMVLCYDRAFVAGSFREAWRQRRRLHLALAATWIPLIALVISAGGDRGGTSGLGAVVSWWGYEQTQLVAVVRYLQLAVWPHPLVFEYGPLTTLRPGEAMGAALVTLPLALAAGWALGKKPALGFLGLWFFGILAPTSLVPGPLQMIVEHRMYLPLAAVLVLLVLGVHELGGRRALAAGLVVAAVWGGMTFHRNRIYRSALTIWADTAVKRPESPTAHSGYAMALADEGRSAEAVVEFERVLQLMPDNVRAHTALGNLLSRAGRPQEGLRHLQRALQLQPTYPDAHLNLAAVLDRMGRNQSAVAEYQEALRLKPDFAEAHNDLSDALRRLGQLPAALREAEAALVLRPDYAAAHYNLADALAQSGRLAEAKAAFATGRRLRAPDAANWHSWGTALADGAQAAEALAAYGEGLRLAPDDATLHYDAANAFAALGRYADAVPEYEQAVRLRPDYPEARDNLGNALALLHRDDEAVTQYRESLRLRPNDARVLNNLGLALARLAQLPAAATAFAAAVGLAPDYQEARDNLKRAQEQMEAPGR